MSSSDVLQENAVQIDLTRNVSSQFQVLGMERTTTGAIRGAVHVMIDKSFVNASAPLVTLIELCALIAYVKLLLRRKEVCIEIYIVPGGGNGNAPEILANQAKIVCQFVASVHNPIGQKAHLRSSYVAVEVRV